MIKRLRTTLAPAYGAALALMCYLDAHAMVAPVMLQAFDEPRHGEPQLTSYRGSDCVRNEAIIVLRSVAAFDEFRRTAELMGDRVAGFIPKLRAVRVVLGDDAQLEQRLEVYSGLAMVSRSEPNLVGDAMEAESIPNDPAYPDQWHLENIGQSGGTQGADVDAQMSWAITRGSSDITVAIVDTGIDLDSPEFAGRLLPGWDFYGEDSQPDAVFPHGTFVTGLLGANANNGFEVAGVDLECMILPIKVGNLSITSFDAAQGVDFAAAQGADIISMSFGFWPLYPQVLDEAVAAAAASGAILVAGAGNEGALGLVDKTWPAASAKTIAVGWTDHYDWRSLNSSAGEALDFVAPGVAVITVSMDASGLPKAFSGASASTPIVSGIVALMKSLNTSLTYEQVYDMLLAGAEDQLGDPLDTPGWDPWYGHGRVNAYSSLQALCGCQGGESLIASPQHVPAATGGIVELVIDFGRDFAHRTYLVLGSASTGGWFPFAGMKLRLTPDEYLQKTLAGPDGVSLIDTSGILDGNGQARAVIVLDALSLGTTDLTLFHQAVVFQQSRPAQVAAISNKTTTVVQGN